MTQAQVAEGNAVSMFGGTTRFDGTVVWTDRGSDGAQYLIIETTDGMLRLGRVESWGIASERLGIEGRAHDVPRFRRMLAAQYALHPVGLYDAQ